MLPPDRGGHCRLLDESQSPKGFQLELESGDVVSAAVSLNRHEAVVTVLDVEKDDSPGTASILARAFELRLLARKLTDMARALEAGW